MTTRYQAEQTLRDEFITNFDSTIPVCFDNRDDFWLCTNPLTISSKPSNGIWVRFYITNNISNQITFASTGNRTFRRMGLIAAQVNTPQGLGLATTKGICEDIINIYEGNKFNDIWCYSGTLKEQGIQLDGFYMIYVTIPFDFDTRK